jgi:hypothetical protein
MFLSAVSLLVVVQPTSIFPEGLMNHPVLYAVYPTLCNATCFGVVFKAIIKQYKLKKGNYSCTTNVLHKRS